MTKIQILLLPGQVQINCGLISYVFFCFFCEFCIVLINEFIVAVKTELCYVKIYCDVEICQRFKSIGNRMIFYMYEWYFIDSFDFN